jgi:hypothetical protein
LPVLRIVCTSARESLLFASSYTAVGRLRTSVRIAKPKSIS